MTKEKGADDHGDDPPAGAGAGQDASHAEPAPAKGLDAAVAHLRGAFGDDVVTLWTTSGPRNSHTEKLAGVLVEIGERPRKLIVQAFTSGGFKLFAEVSGKSPEHMIKALEDEFGSS